MTSSKKYNCFDKPLISVIVPVYNVEKYINRCIDSLLCQTYSNFEIIIIDDGSLDKSGAMCDKYSNFSKVKVFHKTNGGLSSARNYGLEKINGQYVAFVDSDDWVPNDYIQYLYDLISHCSADVARCSFQRIADNENLKDDLNVTIEELSGKEALRLMLRQEHGMNASVCTSLFKKDCFDTIRFPEGKYFEDLGTTYRILANVNRIVVSSASKYAYVIRNESIAHSKFKPEYMDELYFAKQILKYVDQNYADLHFDACIRVRSVAFHLYMMMTNEQLNDPLYNEYEQEFLNIIKRDRYRVIISKNTPLKVRMGTLCSLFGMHIVRMIYYKLGMYGK